MPATDRKEIRVPGMPEPVSHYTDVVRAGRMAGRGEPKANRAHMGVQWKRPRRGWVGGADVTAQARQVHENLKRCLAAAGATFADVCKVTVFLKDVNDREKVNTVRREYFGASRPASTLVEISRLVRDDLLLEIEAVAVLPE